MIHNIRPVALTLVCIAVFQEPCLCELFLWRLMSVITLADMRLVKLLMA